MKFITSLPLLLASASAAAEQYFNRVATFPVCQQLDEVCNVDNVTTAGKLIASDDGMTVAYADDGLNAVGKYITFIYDLYFMYKYYYTSFTHAIWY